MYIWSFQSLEILFEQNVSNDGAHTIYNQQMSRQPWRNLPFSPNLIKTSKTRNQWDPEYKFPKYSAVFEIN